MVASTETVYYPESDGKSMAENTRQFRWIVTIKEGLEWLFAEDPQVFIAGDLQWYPVEGNNRLCQAPDTMAVFGRPKGDRGSYLQWLEGNLPPQVVFEVLSPGNTVREMTRKFQFYQHYGVEEYYIYDPDNGTLDGSVRRDAALELVEEMSDWVSPRLGVRFGLDLSGQLQLWRPDGAPFESYAELAQRAQQAEQQLQIERERTQQVEQQLQMERERAQRLAERLRALDAENENL